MKDDQSVGPVSRVEIARLFTSKAIVRETLVWRAGSEQWRSLSEAFDFARSVPPPLPVTGGAPIGDGAAIAQTGAPTRAAAWTDTEPHPWRRYFARMVDSLLLGSIMWFGVGVLLFALNPDGAEQIVAKLDGPGGRIINSIGTAFLAMFPTALLVGYFGGTPGKWLFGVRIANEDGRPIGLMRAMQRELRVWIYGLGLGLPLISLFTLTSSFSQLKNEGQTSWDNTAQAHATHRTQGAAQYTLSACGVVLFGALFVLLNAP